jgi:hypothetical protein
VSLAASCKAVYRCVQVLYSSAVIYVHEYIYIYIKRPCVCPVYMSKIGMWAFSVSGKEILNFSNYQNSKIPEVVVVGFQIFVWVSN